jgi:CxxC-x17-CxxC domain-containing protein
LAGGINMNKKDTEETSVESEEEIVKDDVNGALEEREMHKIKCSECGKDAEVPFKPTEGRPVYCRDCFMKHRKPRRSFSYRRF